jgi:protein phosphatase
VQLTKDHSLVQALVDAKIIDKAEMRTHPRRNVITAHLGGSLTLQDLEVALAPGDILLLCTDGLTDVVEDTTIAAELKKGGTATEISARLVALAVANGARDNVTAMVVVVS